MKQKDDCNVKLLEEGATNVEINIKPVKPRPCSRTSPFRIRSTRLLITAALLLVLVYLLYSQSNKTGLSNNSLPENENQTSPSQSTSPTTTALTDQFFHWIKSNPKIGIVAYVLTYAIAIVLILPTSPLTLGCGYVFVTSHGWFGGLLVGSVASCLGSLFGAVGCFILGRYWMRECVRRWKKKYVLLDAVDAAIIENGTRILAMLFFTPILPLGPISYLCGTTSMKLKAFVSARILSLPLLILYVFIGASTGSIVDDVVTVATNRHGVSWNQDMDEKFYNNTATVADVGVLKMDGEMQSRLMMLFGVALSVVSLGCISHHVKKEVYKKLPNNESCE